MKTLGGWLGVTAVALIMAGCNGNAFTASGGDASSMVSDDQACGDRAHANCVKIQTCSTEVLSTTFGTEGACETRLKLNCLNALATAENGNNAQADEACAQAFPGLSCANYFDLLPATACLQMTGTVVNGQPCGIPGQCETGFCAIAPGSACGVCAPVPKPGDSCAQWTTCGQLLACISGTKQCAAYAGQGQACSNNGQPCGAGLFCVGGASTTGGTCQTAVEQLGAACDPQGKAAPGCDRLADLTCNSVTKQCAPIVYAPAGAACGAVGNQFAACANGAACVGGSADAGTTATCLPAAADLGACDLVAGPFCLDPARCIVSSDASTSGTCQFANGLACL